MQKTKENLENALPFIKALTGSIRRSIILALLDGNGVETTVTELIAKLGVSQSNVSAELRNLRKDKIVESRREGLNIYYKLNSPFMRDLVNFINYYDVHKPQE